MPKNWLSPNIILSIMISPCIAISSDAMHDYVRAKTILKRACFTGLLLQNTINKVIKLSREFKSANVETDRLSNVRQVSFIPPLGISIDLRNFLKEDLVRIEIGNYLTFCTQGFKTARGFAIGGIVPVRQ